MGQFLGRLRRGLHVAVLCLASAAAGAGSLGDARAAGAAERSAADTDIFYHVFVRSFRDANHDGIGDLNGLRAGLDYLQQLGVTALLLTPVQPSPFYHNYFATDFDAIAPEYGGNAAWVAFLRAAHAHGFKVYMDLEFQYVAGGHPWLSSAWHHPASPYRDWLLWNDPTGDAAGAAEPMASPFGLYAGSADGSSHLITWVNLNHPAVQQYFREYVLRWVDPHGDGSGVDGVDGYRIDHMMDDLDNAHVITHLFRDFWTPLIAAVKARRPAVRFVGEQWDWGYGADYLTRGSADSVFAFPLRDALIRLQKQPILDAIAATEAATPPGKRQVVFLENHDTDRFASVVDADGAKARAGAALLLLLAGDPAIYYGQELGMRGRKGPAEASDAPDIPRREAFRWDADLDADGSATWYRAWDRVWTTRFNRSNDGVSVAEETDDPRSLLSWYRQLIALRRERSEVRRGTQAFPCATASPVLCILRRDGAQQTLLLVNLSDAPASPVLDSAVSIADFRVVIGTGALAAPLAPYDVRVAETP